MEMPKDRLRKAREAAGYESPSAAARAIHYLNKNTLISHENGNRPISKKAAVKYQRAFGIAPAELLFGTNGSGRTDVDLGEVEEAARLPVRGEVAAGQWLETAPFLDDLEIEEWIDGVAASPTLSAFTYCLRVKGTSINRLAPDGSYLVCVDLTSGIRVDSGDVVIVERIHDQGALREVTAKRIVAENGTYVLKPESDDPLWQATILLDHDIYEMDSEVRIVAKVKHVIRPL